jgi:hypothetical protein
MLLCDSKGCSHGCHTYCCTPPLSGIPEGQWLCSSCTAGQAGTRPRRQQQQQQQQGGPASAQQRKGRAQALDSSEDAKEEQPAAAGRRGASRRLAGGGKAEATVGAAVAVSPAQEEEARAPSRHARKGAAAAAAGGSRAALAPRAANKLCMVVLAGRKQAQQQRSQLAQLGQRIQELEGGAAEVGACLHCCSLLCAACCRSRSRLVHAVQR